MMDSSSSRCVYDDDIDDATCVRKSVKQDPSVSYVACHMFLKRQKTFLLYIFRKVRGAGKMQIRYREPDLHFPGTNKIFVRVSLTFAEDSGTMTHFVHDDY